MAELHDVLATYVDDGSVPGAVGLVARDDRTEIVAVGSVAVGGAPMTDDYGWVGGTGTTAHIIPSTGTVAILLTQVAADSPVPPQWMRDFWRYAATAS
jgi:CubicO group peptidase (beta-lactamase class C family)